ncbi:MAG TPA: hypothetical protein VJA21_10290 [Verrucomicrobiae bacterium]
MTSIYNDIDQQLGRPQSGLLVPAPIAPTQEEFITKTPASRASLVKTADQILIPRATVDRFLKRLSEIGAITYSGGLYWLPEAWLYQLSKPLSVMRIDKVPRQAGRDQPHWRSVGPSPRTPVHAAITALPAEPPIDFEPATSEVAVAVAPTGGSEPPVLDVEAPPGGTCSPSPPPPSTTLNPQLPK